MRSLVPVASRFVSATMVSLGLASCRAVLEIEIKELTADEADAGPGVAPDAATVADADSEVTDAGTDTATCGACRVCSDQGICVGELVTRLDGSSGQLVGADQYLFYASSTLAGSAHRVAKNGKSAVVVAQDLGDRLRLRQSGVGLFIVQGAKGRIALFPNDGSGTKSIATGVTGLVDVAANGTSLYVARTNEIDVMPQAGGTPAAITTVASNVTSLVADDEHVFFADDSGLVRIDHAGGGRQVLLGKSIERLVQGGDDLFFFTTVNAGHVFRMPKTGGTPVAVASSQVIGGFAIEGNYLYYTCESGMVRRVRNDLGATDANTPVTVAEGQENGTDLVLGLKADLYWLAGSAIFSGSR